MVERIPYLRGDLLALRWNAAIKRSSGGTYSIDNLMADLLAAATSAGIVVSADNIDTLIRPYLTNGVRKDIQKYVEEGSKAAHDHGMEYYVLIKYFWWGGQVSNVGRTRS
jgi:predicted metalloprotease with PDZ domain